MMKWFHSIKFNVFFAFHSTISIYSVAWSCKWQSFYSNWGGGEKGGFISLQKWIMSSFRTSSNTHLQTRTNYILRSTNTNCIDEKNGAIYNHQGASGESITFTILKEKIGAIMPLVNDQGSRDNKENATSQREDGIQWFLHRTMDDVSFHKDQIEFNKVFFLVLLYLG